MSRGVDWDKLKRDRRVWNQSRYNPIDSFVPKRVKKHRKK
jgi:hypothetical protein